MNKRIKKKNDVNRIFNKRLEVAIKLATEIADVYARLEGYEEANNIFWRNCEEEFDEWVKLPRGKRCWTYILKKHNIRKVYEYKNKTIII